MKYFKNLDEDDIADFVEDNKWIKPVGYVAVSVLGLFLLGKVFKILSSTVDSYNMLNRSIKNSN